MTKKKKINIIGVMTGTSIDGIDISYLRTNGTNYVKIIKEKSYKFEKLYKDFLNKIIVNKSKINIKNRDYVEKIEHKVNLYYIKYLKKFINQNKINKKNIDFISISGQTVYHNPKVKLSIQLGNGKEIAKKLKIKTISNFRDKDIRLGGEGAPIGSYYHKYLINNIKQKVIIVNLGGIANFSAIKSNKLISSDIGPANCLTDDLSYYFFKKNFDRNGNLAKLGEINSFLINEFKKDKFFKLQFPKSLDRNYFNNYFKKLIKLNKFDALATANYMTYLGVKHLITKIKFNFDIIILTGGGRKNNFLRKILKDNIDKKISNIEKYNIDGDLVEAQMFGYIGARSYKKLPISNKNTTGVKQTISGGVINYPL